jgi:hypothetical protein
MEVPFSYHNILLVAMIFGCHSFVKINLKPKYKDLQLEIIFGDCAIVEIIWSLP